jgi:hypothetical protein
MLDMSHHGIYVYVNGIYVYVSSMSVSRDVFLIIYTRNTEVH